MGLLETSFEVLLFPLSFVYQVCYIIWYIKDKIKNKKKENIFFFVLSKENGRSIYIIADIEFSSDESLIGGGLLLLDNSGHKYYFNYK